MEEGVFESSDAALGRLWSMSIAKGHGCSLPSTVDGEADIKHFVSTASVARDMLELVERHGEWREGEAKRMIEVQTKQEGTHANVSDVSLACLSDNGQRPDVC